jgi:hypothetical protein
MQTEIIRSIPIVPALLLYWSILVAFFVVQTRRRARHELAKRVEVAGTEDFEISLPLPIAGFVVAAALPLVLLILLALIA